ncbi:MAG: hypothetical protein H0X29_02295 [Parachlamydiaceae bacterium]|nr:hypothetical protein [Parachlamydiaceae bacterium]
MNTAECNFLIELLIKHLDVINAAGLNARDSRPADTAGTCDPFLIATAWIRDFINVLQSSILPVLDPGYKDLHAYEKRLHLNLIGLQAYLNKIKTLKIGKKSNVLKKLNLNFFNQITPLSPLIARILGKINNYSNHDNFTPFVAKDLKVLARELKPLIANLFLLLSDCTNKHSDKLKNMDLLDRTANIGEVLLIKHDIDALLFRKSPWPQQLPEEYMQFISLETEKEDNQNETLDSALLETDIISSLSEEEDEGALTVLDEDEQNLISLNTEEKKYPSLINAEEKFPSMSEDEEDDEVEDSTTSPSLNSTSSDSSTAIIPTKRFDLKENMSLRLLGRALKKLRLRREEGSRHTLWVDPQGRKLIGPRHGIPGRGLMHAMQNQFNAMQENKDYKENPNTNILTPSQPQIAKKHNNKPKRR